MPDTPPRTPPARLIGHVLLLVSAVAFSTAGLFTRQASVDLPALLVWRNALGGVSLLVIVAARGGGDAVASVRRLGGRGWAVVAASSLATVCYLAALRTTSVADVAVIYASAPLVTALMARAWLGEPLSARTLLAAVLALLGVGLTTVGGGGHGGLLGDGLAATMTLLLALTVVLSRRRDPLPALLLSGLSAALTALAVLPFALGTGASLALGAADAGWLALFALVTVTLAMPCYFAGAARLPAVRTMLLSVLEMPLAPLWVWLVFAEAPSAATWAGGALVGAAVGLGLTDRA